MNQGRLRGESGVIVKKKKHKRNLLGRDPAMGRVSFKSGVILTPKDKVKNRKSKIHKKNLRLEKEDEL
jgi:hypothetical protein